MSHSFEFDCKICENDDDNTVSQYIKYFWNNIKKYDVIVNFQKNMCNEEECFHSFLDNNNFTNMKNCFLWVLRQFENETTIVEILYINVDAKVKHRVSYYMYNSPEKILNDDTYLILQKKFKLLNNVITHPSKYILTQKDFTPFIQSYPHIEFIMFYDTDDFVDFMEYKNTNHNWFIYFIYDIYNNDVDNLVIIHNNHGYEIQVDFLSKQKLHKILHKITFQPNLCNYCSTPLCRSFCSRCRNTFYCNSECQHNDWSNHKKICIYNDLD